MGIGKTLGIYIGLKLTSSPYGPELINEGDFSNGGAAWTVSGESTVNTGVGRVYTSDGSYSAINNGSILTIGKTYKLEYDITDVSVAGGGLRSNDNQVIYPINLGHNTFTFVATEDYFYMKRVGGITDISVDNISVKEVL